MKKVVQHCCKCPAETAKLSQNEKVNEIDNRIDELENYIETTDRKNAIFKLQETESYENVNIRP